MDFRSKRLLQAVVTLSVIVPVSQISVAQQLSVSEFDGKRATRCHIITKVAADMARTPERRESSTTMAKLLLRVAARGAGSRAQLMEWLGEIRNDPVTPAQIDDCKALIQEQAELLDKFLQDEQRKQ